MNTHDPTHLEHQAVLLVSGPDARNFLQGQLTIDVQTLTATNVLLAACNSPQGRVQTVLWIVERSDGIALLVHRPMLQQTLTRLRRYVLRAKVTIDSERLQVGVTDAAAFIETPTQVRTHTQLATRSYVRLPDHRQVLVIAPTGEVFAENSAAELSWRLDHVRAGLPEIHPQTHEQFVAQMLNLDLLDGISFEKGCYTGQEIIARTHYRGAIKRRMFRFRAARPAPVPGDRLLVGDQHAGDVVDAVDAENGCELLAVVSLAQLSQPIEIEGDPRVRLERVTLPYEVLME